MNEATKVFRGIESAALKTRDNSLQRVGILSPGDFVSQGDINIWCLPEIPEGAIKVAVEAQIAPGTTRGSRHCIKQSDLSKVTQYKLNNSNAIQGPIFELHSPITIEHPEHGDQVHSSRFIFISYQRRFSDELERVLD